MSAYTDWKGETGPGAMLRRMGMNPAYHPKSAQTLSLACRQLDDEGMYDRVTSHSERRELIRERYTKLMEKYQ